MGSNTDQGHVLVLLVSVVQIISHTGLPLFASMHIHRVPAPPSALLGLERVAGISEGM